MWLEGITPSQRKKWVMLYIEQSQAVLPWSETVRTLGLDFQSFATLKDLSMTQNTLAREMLDLIASALWYSVEYLFWPTASI